MYGKCISRLCSASSFDCVIVSKAAVADSSAMISWSRDSWPKGVS
jgi:hypothetical protein